MSSNQSSMYEQCKCSQHNRSHIHQLTQDKYAEIIQSSASQIASVNTESLAVIQIAFHFIAPSRTFTDFDVRSRANQVIASLVQDFNGYSTLPFNPAEYKYRNIINQVFDPLISRSNNTKQSTYLSPDRLIDIPVKPSSIMFELGEIYYYPVKKMLDLHQYHDIEDADAILTDIRKYIFYHRAVAVLPERVLNIWIVHTSGSGIQGYSSYPWQTVDHLHGIVLDRAAFFPEDQSDSNMFNSYHSITHHVGHYLGLPHVYSRYEVTGINPIINFNIEPDAVQDQDFIPPLINPIEGEPARELHNDTEYNPDFTNFMSHTSDAYVSHFNRNQIQEMRYMIQKFRPRINSVLYPVQLPPAQYQPDTGTINLTRRTRMNDERMSRNNTRENPLRIRSRDYNTDKIDNTVEGYGADQYSGMQQWQQQQQDMMQQDMIQPRTQNNPAELLMFNIRSNIPASSGGFNRPIEDGMNEQYPMYDTVFSASNQQAYAPIRPIQSSYPIQQRYVSDTLFQASPSTSPNQIFGSRSNSLFP